MGHSGVSGGGGGGGGGGGCGWWWYTERGGESGAPAVGRRLEGGPEAGERPKGRLCRLAVAGPIGQVETRGRGPKAPSERGSDEG
jgi:hypothetical protein